jgi:hypothetical protein
MKGPRAASAAALRKTLLKYFDVLFFNKITKLMNESKCIWISAAFSECWWPTED